MTKQKALRRICIMVVCALLCSLSFLSVTLAKYTTEINGSASVAVDTWEITAEGETSEFTINLGDKAAPGKSGDIKINLANNGTVDATYSIEIIAGEKPVALTLTPSGACTGSLAAGDELEDLVIGSWSWDFDAADNDDNDWYSTEENAKTITFTVKVTGAQANPVGEQA